MTYSRHKNPHHPESALADYLQDLLPFSAELDSAPDDRSPDPDGDASEQSALTPKAARQGRSAARGAPPEWAEPPVLDPRVFAPRIQDRPEAVPEPAEPEARTAEAPDTEVPVAPAPVEPAPIAPPAAAPETEMLVPAAARSRWVGGRPEWAQGGFDCLLFSVSGLKLAVPLVLLGAVHPLDRELTPLVGRPQWFMGLLARGERNTRVVDTARWVMPDRYRVDARASYEFVIRLDDSEWGLACDEVAQSFRLKPDEVKWRSEDSRRPWLAGTVKNHMCALLDVGEFARMLARAEKTQQLDLDS